MPPARPSCGRCVHGRLLLHQQRRRRRAMVPRPGRQARVDPRCRLPPRQRHAGDLLSPRRYPGAQPAWRPDGRVSLLPRPRRRARRRRRRRFQRQLPHALRHRLGRLERVAGGCLRQAHRLRPRCRHRLARRRHLREGPDQPVQAEERRLPQDRPPHRQARPADAVRHGRRLRRGRDRHQCRRRADRLRGSLIPTRIDLRPRIQPGAFFCDAAGKSSDQFDFEITAKQLEDRSLSRNASPSDSILSNRI
ncbi:hypothetical protein MPLA_160125 [Mesorhizobium sp. ORS 3359]|nr:hypothetical protein MPLA_160125 [Mesorhizobium sp. ORS 3359]